MLEAAKVLCPSIGAPSGLASSPEDSGAVCPTAIGSLTNDSFIRFESSDLASASRPVVKAGVEVDGVGNLDDTVLYRASPPNDYAQVKYAVDSQTPVGEEYLLAPSATNGPSVLAKIFHAWRGLVAEGKPFHL